MDGVDGGQGRPGNQVCCCEYHVPGNASCFISSLQGAVGPPGPDGPQGRRGPPGLPVSQCNSSVSPTYTLPLLHALQSNTCTHSHTLTHTHPPLSHLHTLTHTYPPLSHLHTLTHPHTHTPSQQGTPGIPGTKGSKGEEGDLGMKGKQVSFSLPESTAL